MYVEQVINNQNYLDIVERHSLNFTEPTCLILAGGYAIPLVKKWGYDVPNGKHHFFTITLCL
jgi:hypothetical protein